VASWRNWTVSPRIAGFFPYPASSGSDTLIGRFIIK